MLRFIGCVIGGLAQWAVAVISFGTGMWPYSEYSIVAVTLRQHIAETAIYLGVFVLAGLGFVLLIGGIYVFGIGLGLIEG